ncbi:MAG: tRNA uridine-5-carboxymethylaminomethyl(34) synthesis GTPase MnmE [Ruminococcus sp.]|nr:tRNA uridine-5-carboxymethylaminomethyl(34) synthesis GTPase MnmE [Ruminococcus sp.]
MFQGSAIAALSTPRAAGGIAVIRISGEKALEIAGKVFRPVSSEKTPAEMEGYTCAYGKFIYLGEEIDDGILTVFKAPRSYTGEDTAELSCHGGLYVTERILRALYENGAVPAAPGEFTKRAFLNGKISLTQAEAVMDIISAQGRAYHRRAENVREGALYRRISEYTGKLLDLLAAVDAWVDYPEEDIPEVDGANMINTLSDILRGLEAASSEYDNTKILREGIDAVIAGKPNVGKSTLMNALSGCERSIVTDIAGTTRDIVEESVRMGDIILKLSDTAGIRETEDIVEGAGIQRAKKRMETADLVIAVFDSTAPFDKDDRELTSFCKRLSVKTAACINKTDSSLSDTAALKKELSECFDNVIEISAKNGVGIDDLQKVLSDMFITNSNTVDEITVNERQKQCLDRAAACVREAMEAVNESVTLDAVNIILDEALNALNELTGERAEEAVINKVFSNFCVGK